MNQRLLHMHVVYRPRAFNTSKMSFEVGSDVQVLKQKNNHHVLRTSKMSFKVGSDVKIVKQKNHHQVHQMWH
jgi:hypothetical protein